MFYTNLDFKMYNPEPIVRRGRLEENAVRTVLGEIAQEKQKDFDSRFTTFTAATFKPKQDYLKNVPTIQIYSNTENNGYSSVMDGCHAKEMDGSEKDNVPTMMTLDWVDTLLENNDFCSSSMDADIDHAEDMDDTIDTEMDDEPTMTPNWMDALLKTDSKNHVLCSSSVDADEMDDTTNSEVNDEPTMTPDWMDALLKTNKKTKDLSSLSRDAEDIDDSASSIGHAEEFDESANSSSSESDDVITMSTPGWFVGLLNTDTPSEKLPVIDTVYLTSPEYTQDIYSYLRAREKNHKFNWSYMSQQSDITHNMRSILIDWLVEVAEEYKLLPETLHLTISCMDRFMSKRSVHRSKLQLVGITAMFIASKYEEVHSPDIQTFIYISDNSYTKKQLLGMEKLLLAVLDFDLSLPTSHLFITQFCNMFHLDQRSTFLANYLSELALLNGEIFLRFSPSILAAGCVALARHTLGEEIWSDEMAEKSGYSLEFTPCLIKLYHAFKDADRHPQQSIQKKYRNVKFDQVAQLSRQVSPLPSNLCQLVV